MGVVKTTATLQSNHLYMKLVKSFSFAFQGIITCYRTQQNFRIHLAATAIVIVLGILLHISPTEWLFIAGSCVLVISLEMVNTGLEEICNIISPEFHPLIKKIKDISAGAVLVAAGGALFTGCIILLPKIINEIKTLQ